MRDKLPLITIIVVVIVLIGSVSAVVMLENNSYKKQTAKKTEQISKIQKEVDKIKLAKDVNNFTPTEAVTLFLNEVKSNSAEKEKLYLSSTVQDMDVKNTLKLGSNLVNLTIGDSEQTIDGDNAEVKINLEVDGDQVARTFSLANEEGAWKIIGVTAE